VERVAREGTSGRFKVWAEQGFEDAGPALVALAMQHKDQYSSRKTKATSLLSLYEGMSLARFNAEAYSTAEPFYWDD